MMPLDCGKKRYPHQRAARESAERQVAYAKERGEALRLRVYRCDKRSCKGWHVTELRDE